MVTEKGTSRCITRKHCQWLVLCLLSAQFAQERISQSEGRFRLLFDVVQHTHVYKQTEHQGFWSAIGKYTVLFDCQDLILLYHQHNYVWDLETKNLFAPLKTDDENEMTDDRRTDLNPKPLICILCRLLDHFMCCASLFNDRKTVSYWSSSSRVLLLFVFACTAFRKPQSCIVSTYRPVEVFHCQSCYFVLNFVFPVAPFVIFSVMFVCRQDLLNCQFSNKLSWSTEKIRDWFCNCPKTENCSVIQTPRHSHSTALSMPLAWQNNI